MKIKTGECYYRDEIGNLWLAESFVDTETGEVTTQDTLIEEAPPIVEEPPIEQTPYYETGV